MEFFVSLMQCRDKKISRNHAVVNVLDSEHTINIKSVSYNVPERYFAFTFNPQSRITLHFEISRHISIQSFINYKPISNH
jgi:hypothetical protein